MEASPSTAAAAAWSPSNAAVAVAVASPATSAFKVGKSPDRAMQYLASSCENFKYNPQGPSSYKSSYDPIARHAASDPPPRAMLSCAEAVTDLHIHSDDCLATAHFHLSLAEHAYTALCATPCGPEAAAVTSRRRRMAVLQVDHATTNWRVRRKHHAQATGRLQLALRCLQEHVPPWRAKQ